MIVATFLSLILALSAAQPSGYAAPSYAAPSYAAPSYASPSYDVHDVVSAPDI